MAYSHTSNGLCLIAHFQEELTNGYYMEHSGSLLYVIFIIFSGAAVLSTFSLLTRQSMLVSYIFLGVLIGPYCIGFIKDAEVVMQVGEVGIMFLLFLLGLHLQPSSLVKLLRKVTKVSIISSILFLALGYGVSRLFGFGNAESIVIGAAMMFSSTIIGLKLLPTTILHHHHTGEMMIGILLMQDILAIIVLLGINGAKDGFLLKDMISVLFSLPALMAIAYIAEKYVLSPLLKKFDQVQEYIFILAVGWCLGLSQMSGIFNLSPEIGAFVAGISLASSNISLFIAESLKPLRDFFLVMFFASIGATFNLEYLPKVILPALVLSAAVLILKPLIYSYLLKFEKEEKSVANEVGLRLGQGSEFALLVAKSAFTYSIISSKAIYFVQATTILTFVISSYIVIFLYPTPLGTSEKMRQN